MNSAKFGLVALLLIGSFVYVSMKHPDSLGISFQISIPAG
jgi:hypothetical protein